MKIKEQLAIQALYNSGNFPEREEVTRESIAKMKKPDVADLLEAHGVTPTGGVAEMRAALTAAMFMEA